MGRTTRTFRQRLSQFRSEWEDFRRGLRNASQSYYDTIIEYPEKYVDAAGYCNPTDIVPPVFISIDLEQEKQLDDLRQRITELEREVDTLEDQLDQSESTERDSAENNP